MPRIKQIGRVGLIATVDDIDAKTFVSRLQPSLANGDWTGLVETLHASWTPAQIATMLAEPDADARKLAALSLGLVGRPDCLGDLTVALHDRDRMVAEMAEHALWQVWFRGGSEEANRFVARGADALNNEQTERAVELFNKAISACPDYAEAYNQRAIAHYLAERYEESSSDCWEVLRRMPTHFGAWAGLGHCLIAQGKIAEAVDAYQRALDTHPGLDCIAEVVRELRDQLAEEE